MSAGSPHARMERWLGSYADSLPAGAYAELVALWRDTTALIATPPAPQRMAQGDECLHESWDVIGGGRRCVDCRKFLGADTVEEATQPPHQDRGEVDQRARELLAAEYRTHGWHEDAGRLCMGGDTTTFVEDDALRVVGRLLEEGDEDSHVITELGRLLAQIAITLKGPEPAGTAWSYHDLPAMVAALTEAKQQGPGEAESPSLKQTPAWWVGYSIGHTGRAPYHCIGPDKPPSQYANDSVHWTPLYTAPQVEAKRLTGGDHD